MFTVLVSGIPDRFPTRQTVEVHYERIVDARDERLADYIDLTDPEIRRRYEHEGFFIAEGLEVVKRLILSDVRCRSIVVAPNRIEAMSAFLNDAQCPVYIADRHVVSQVIGFDLHRGVIASGQRPDPVNVEQVLQRPPLSGVRHVFAALHGVGDHENLGAIVRSARAFQIDALVLDPTCADPFYRRSVRVSMGEIFFLPVVHMKVEELIGTIRRYEGSSVAFTPRPDALSIDRLPFPSGPLGLIFGSEGFGLPDKILNAADIRARIPIAAVVDSLNVGHAAAIAFAAAAKLRSDQES